MFNEPRYDGSDAYQQVLIKSALQPQALFQEQAQPQKPSVRERFFHYLGDVLILSGIKIHRLADQEAYSPGFRPG